MQSRSIFVKNVDFRVPVAILYQSVLCEPDSNATLKLVIPFLKIVISLSDFEMSEEASSEGLDKSNTLVDLSVSGTCFTVPRSVLTDQNWVLSRIPEFDMPWGVYHNGRYFVDADPQSFRWVLHFVRYVTPECTVGGCSP